MDLSDQRADVADILISLAQRDTKNRSATLADLLVRALDDHVRLLGNTHRFAGFAVLKAPDIPSVLVEIGFLSHPEEERLLKSPRYRSDVAKGISKGVDAYFEYSKKLGVQ
jgi:N-acetylmuramoyl-L-alanine amidase